MKRILLIVLTAWIGTAAAFCVQNPLEFEDAVHRALEQNLQIRILKNSRDIARNRAHPGYAGLWPSLGISGNVNSQKSLSGQDPAEDRVTTGIYTLGLGYTLFDGLGNLYQFRNLKIQNELTGFETRNLIESTVLEVSRAYYSASLAYQQFKITEELIGISRERYQRAQNRSQIGRLGTVQLLSAKVDLATDRITLTKARYQWENARRYLNLLLDRPLDTVYEISSRVDVIGTYRLEELQRKGLVANAAYMAARTRIQKAETEEKIVQSGALPRLNLSASYSLSGLSPQLDLPLEGLSSNPMIGISMDIPVFNGWRRVIDQKNARIGVQNSRLAAEKEEKELRRRIREAYESLQNEKQVMDLEEEHLELARLNFDRTRELFNLGQVTTTQFREAQLNLFQARTNLMEARMTARIKEIELLYLSGQLIQVP